MQLYVALALQGVTVPVKRLAGYGSLAAVILKLLRLLPWPFGLHVPIHAALMVVIVHYLAQGPWTMALIGALVSQLLVAIGEGLLAAPLMNQLGFTYREVLSNAFLNIAFGYVADTFLLLAVAYCWVRHRKAKARAGR